jgi:type I restriction enzyme M protein
MRVVKMECFSVLADEIEGRIDPFYYKPEFVELYKKLSKTKLVSFGEIITSIINGFDYRKFSDEGLTYLRVSNIKPFEFDLTEVKKINPNFTINKNIKLKKGDLLLTRKGTFGVALILEKDEDYIISSEIFKIELTKDTNPKFIEIILNSNIGQKQFDKYKIGAIMGSLSQEAVKKIKIPLPLIQTQNKIVKLMDNAYKIKKQKETKAQQLLDSINDYVLNGLGIKFSPIREDKIYCINSEELENNRSDPYYFNPKFKRLLADLDKCKIKLTKIYDVAKKVFNGKTPAKEDYAENGNFILKVRCLKNNKIVWDKLSFVKGTIPLVKTVNDKDILLLSSAHQSEYLGKNPSIVVMPKNLKDKKIYFVGELINIRADMEKINPYYLLAILKLHEYYLFVNREKRGQTSHLYPDDLGNVKIPLPPLPIQNKIAEEVKRRMQKAEQLQKKAKEELEKAKQEVEKIILD